MGEEVGTQPANRLPDKLPDAATLQALTETAVARREERPLVAAELVVPVIQLAQQVTSQLAAYDLAGEKMWVGGGFAGASRYYSIQEVSWKTGKIGRREAHTAYVLVRETGNTWRVMWDPRNPSMVWDVDNPPACNLKGLLEDDDWSGNQLADAATLAQFAKDALPLVESVVARENNRTQHLQDGLQQAHTALDTLAV